LYHSRAEAEFARARLISDVGARSSRIIGRDTAAAVDGLRLSPKDVQSYRAGISDGGHLLVAQVPRGRSSKQLIALLTDAIGKGDEVSDVRVPNRPGVHVDIGRQHNEATRLRTDDRPQKNEPHQQAEEQRSVSALFARPETPARAPAQPQATSAPPNISQEEHIPVVEEELRIQKQEVPRGGARMRAYTRETDAEEQVDLRQEVVEIESRQSGRRLDDKEIEPGGVFTERVFEFSEIREEPVVRIEAFVREELIIRKRVNERTETVHDTVRHTEVEVEDLAEKDAAAPAFFGRNPGDPRA
jgi:stress response protein YsnF